LLKKGLTTFIHHSFNHVGMKKHLLQLSLAVMLIGLAPFAQAAATPVKATPTPIPATAPSLAQTKEALVLLNRLETIQAMDIDGMKNADKRALRKEVKAIEKQMKALQGGGVYISVGAIIIILLLIILFL